MYSHDGWWSKCATARSHMSDGGPPCSRTGVEDGMSSSSGTTAASAAVSCVSGCLRQPGPRPLTTAGLKLWCATPCGVLLCATPCYPLQPPTQCQLHPLPPPLLLSLPNEGRRAAQPPPAKLHRLHPAPKWPPPPARPPQRPPGPPASPWRQHNFRTAQAPGAATG
jgi:hypothetical protein